MKKKISSKSGFVNWRNVFAIFLCTFGLVLASFAATSSKHKLPRQRTTADLRPVHRPAAPVTPAAASPTGGTLTSANIGTSNALNYADAIGSSTNETFFAGMGTCAVPMSCSTYTLTIAPSVGTPSTGYDPTKYDIFIEIVWAHSAEDYDTFVCATAGNCVQGNI